MRSYSMEIWNKVAQHLKEQDIHSVAENKERGYFRFPMHIEGMIRSVSTLIAVNDDNFVVMAISPLGADISAGDMLGKMSEFINRANYGLRNGNFELDFTDGEIRYKCYVDCEDSLPSDSVIQNSILCPVAMFHKYFPGMIDVMFHDVSPEQAVKNCESEGGIRALLDDFTKRLKAKRHEQPEEMDKGDAPDAVTQERAPLSFEDFISMMAHDGDDDSTDDSVVEEAGTDSEE